MMRLGFPQPLEKVTFPGSFEILMIVANRKKDESCGQKRLPLSKYGKQEYGNGNRHRAWG